MPKRAHVWTNFELPSGLAEDENFLITLKSRVISEASEDAPSHGDLAAIIHKYNAASEDERETMNDVFVWMTGYSLPSLASRAYLEGKGLELNDEAIHDQMIKWADAAKWKGAL